MIKVLIVEDDPMVAVLNERYVSQMDGFTICGMARNTDEAKKLLSDQDIDLMLLDIYMPGLNGIEFLKQIREQNEDIDVILITAASDINQIQQSLRFGAVDYLIKPFEFDRFKEALLQYKNNYYKLNVQAELNQEQLDKLLRKKQEAEKIEKKPTELPKGLTKNTLATIHEVIQRKDTNLFSTEEIAEASNISRVSVRKYLKFLSGIDYLEETLDYGVGRPIYQYRINSSQENAITPYL
ncbi:response regulator [Halobacillus massiliensis]|uniref:response regulator n=1 Tax=Halobacillus massiliensis TaxID=1926286 RepID=UPI0009E3F081|nr:response regulator [Halobacillus massiliensis]